MNLQVGDVLENDEERGGSAFATCADCSMDLSLGTVQVPHDQRMHPRPRTQRGVCRGVDEEYVQFPRARFAFHQSFRTSVNTSSTQCRSTARSTIAQAKPWTPATLRAEGNQVQPC